MAGPGLRVVVRQDLESARSAVQLGAFNLVIIYADARLERWHKYLKDIREIASGLAVLVITPTHSPEIESTAFEGGAALYFAEPVSAKTLERVILQTSGEPTADAPTEPSRTASPFPETVRENGSPLHILRGFSNVLGFSLDYKAFSQHFILKLREHISFSRIAIFLEVDDNRSFAHRKASTRLECIASLGLPADLVDCFQLSRDTGIGKTLCEHPRVLSFFANGRCPQETHEKGVAKEFNILGCQVAIPISDRERTLGVAVLNGPVTGRHYSEDELQLLYLLMEELGLAIRNSRLHAELARHGQLIENVLSSMTSGAIVVSEELQLLYANHAARRFLELDLSNQEPIDFAALPSQLAFPIHRAVEKGELAEPFLISGPRENQVYRVSIFPFSQKHELILLPRPIMVILEDFTKIEASKRSAMDDSKSELIGIIAERFAHEIRNSLVPLSTHAQLIDKKIEEPKFRASLKAAMIRETARIKRLSEQMLYLAQDSTASSEAIDLLPNIQMAFTRAQRHVGGDSDKSTLDLVDECDGTAIQGNAEALAYAFEEIFVNSMQACTEPQTIQVRLTRNSEGIVNIRLKDQGPGFPDNTLNELKEPFFTTRNTGVGLGLSVADKVVTEHNGYLRLNARTPDRDWDIEIELPALVITQSNA